MRSEKFHQRKRMEKMYTENPFKRIHRTRHIKRCVMPIFSFFSSNIDPLIRFNEKNKGEAEISSLRLLRVQFLLICFVYSYSFPLPLLPTIDSVSLQRCCHHHFLSRFFSHWLALYPSSRVRTCENYLGKDWCMIFLFGALIELFVYVCGRPCALSYS